MATKILKAETAREIFEAERTKYINRVNNVLKSHQGTIEELSVRFYVDDEESCKTDIYKWLNFALENRVQKLELDFMSGKFNLTTEFLPNQKLDSIKVLSLRSIQVTDEAVEQIITLCPFLEFLSLTESRSLMELTICGPSLKHLEIECCQHLQLIEISAKNLVSCKHRGSSSLFFYDLPNLVDLSLKGRCVFPFVRNISQFSRYISQLQTFKLDLFALELGKYPEFPMVNNLINLHLRIRDFDASKFGASALLYLSSSLALCPSLHKLNLEILWSQSFKRKYEMKEKEANPHCSLNVIELSGNCINFFIYIEVARHLLKTAVSLEKLLIYRQPYSDGEPKEYDRKKTRIARAELKTSLPPGAKLMVFSPSRV